MTKATAIKLLYIALAKTKKISKKRSTQLFFIVSNKNKNKNNEKEECMSACSDE